MQSQYWALLYLLAATLIEWQTRSCCERIRFSHSQIQAACPEPLQEVCGGGFVIVPKPSPNTAYQFALYFMIPIILAFLPAANDKDLVPMAFLLVASMFDMLFSQIPNSITFGMAVWGLALRIFNGDSIYLQNTVDSVMHCLLIILIAVPALRMGGGDIKLMMACGIWLGWPRAGLAVYLSFVGLTVMALISLIWQHGFKGLIERCKDEVWALLHHTTMKPAYVGIGAPIITAAYQITLLLC